MTAVGLGRVNRVSGHQSRSVAHVRNAPKPTCPHCPPPALGECRHGSLARLGVADRAVIDHEIGVAVTLPVIEVLAVRGRALATRAECASCLGASAQAAACGRNGGLDGQCSGTIPQCSNLEHEFNHSRSKLCILGFEPLKQSLSARTARIKPRGPRIPQWQT
jgi:hypothetical protein